MSRLVLGIETSCDETAAAVVRVDDERSELLADVVASSMDEHARFGGIIPEIASRAHLEQMIPVVSAVLERAGGRARRTSTRSRSPPGRGWWVR